MRRSQRPPGVKKEGAPAGERNTHPAPAGVRQQNSTPANQSSGVTTIEPGEKFPSFAERRRRAKERKRARRRASLPFHREFAILGREEAAAWIPGVGAFITSEVGGLQVVEAVALAEPGEDRAVVAGRHARLEAIARRALGDGPVNAAKRRREVVS